MKEYKILTVVYVDDTYLLRDALDNGWQFANVSSTGTMIVYILFKDKKV